MSVHRGYIINAADGSDLEIEVDDDLPIETLLDIEEQWAASRLELRRKLKTTNISRSDWPQSLHWDWGRKGLQLALRRGPGEVRVMAIRRQDVWEAAMVTLFNGHQSLLAPDIGKPLVYVDYLETAPWNWSVAAISQPRKFKAVGPALLHMSIAQSYAKGWRGRVGLHALPQAAAFYQSQGFDFVKIDTDKQNLPYYELTAAEALIRTGSR